MVLSAGRRGHRDQLAHGGEDAEVAEPDEEEAVENACRATVVEALGEKHRDGFPSDENGAAETENRHEAKVALRDVSVRRAGNRRVF